MAANTRRAKTTPRSEVNDFKDSNVDSTNKTENIDPSEITKDLLQEALNMEIDIETKQDKTINKDTFNSLIDSISKHYNTTPALALVGLFCTLQAGGTNNNKRSNIKITITKIAFESKTINSHIIRTCKGITPRQLARIFAQQIYSCALKYSITGNAYTYILRYHSKLLEVENKIDTDRFWCADFQIDNPDCPEYIRHALRQRYNDKFIRNIQRPIQ